VQQKHPDRAGEGLRTLCTLDRSPPLPPGSGELFFKDSCTAADDRTTAGRGSIHAQIATYWKRQGVWAMRSMASATLARLLKARAGSSLGRGSARNAARSAHHVGSLRAGRQVEEDPGIHALQASGIQT